MRILAKFGFCTVVVMMNCINSTLATSTEILVDDPAIIVCETTIKEKLGADQSYKRAEVSLIYDTVTIKYDFINPSQETIRDHKSCVFKKNKAGQFILAIAEVRAAYQVFNGIEEEISSPGQLSNERRIELQKLVDDTMMAAFKGAIETSKDADIAEQLDIYPIDPTRTQLSMRKLRREGNHPTVRR